MRPLIFLSHHVTILQQTCSFYFLICSFQGGGVPPLTLNEKNAYEIKIKKKSFYMSLDEEKTYSQPICNPVTTLFFSTGYLIVILLSFFSFYLTIEIDMFFISAE